LSSLHLEHFAAPWKILIGGDSHTVAAGGVGSFAVGVGGFDNAMAIAGEPFYLTMPKIVKVNLTGRLQPFVSAKNIILELLRIVSVKGGIGKVFEYSGEGVKTLNVSERSTITNMGAETGATTSISLVMKILENGLRHSIVKKTSYLYMQMQMQCTMM